MIISIISAIGKNNEIGKKNDLLWSLPADMKHFKETTSGHPVIMGQKTFESLKTDENGKQIGRLLPNRRNIIITLDESFQVEGAEIVHSVDELMGLLKNSNTPSPLASSGHSPFAGGELRTSPQPSPYKGEGEERDEEVFVIGGGTIYKIMMEKADKLYITHVDESFSDAEVFFPTIEADKWKKVKSEKYPKDEQNAYGLEFAEYVRE